MKKRGRYRGSSQGKYYQGDDLAWSLPDSLLPAGLTAEEWREAHRALKGQALRSEVYGGTDTNPFTTTESNYSVKLLQPRGQNRYASFLCIPAERLSYQYEQDPSDPRISHKLTIETDPYGLPLTGAEVAYGRRGTGHAEAQGKPKVVVTQQEYIHLDTEPDGQRIGLPDRIKAWELTGVSPDTGHPFQNGVDGDLYEAFATAGMLPYLNDPNPGFAEKRQIVYVDALYYNAAVTAALPSGEASLHGLLYRSSQLALTESMRMYVFGGIPQISDSLLTTTGGYEQRNFDFYLPSALYSYDTSGFYTVTKVTDPFGTETAFTWDDYALAIMETEDAYNNITTVETDYRVLAPWQITDPNGNRRAVAFDTRGLVYKTAVMGKAAGPVEGDTLDKPTTELAYDLFQYLDEGKPNCRGPQN